MLTLVLAPTDQVARVQIDLVFKVRNRIRTLVAAEVHVHTEPLAIRGKRMAVAADRQVLQHDRGPLTVDRPIAPHYLRRIPDRVEEWQIDLPVHQRSPHRILRTLDFNFARRTGF